MVGRNKEWMGVLENNIQKDSGVGVMGSCWQWEEGGVTGCILEESREGVMDSERGMERFKRLCRISVVVALPFCCMFKLVDGRNHDEVGVS